MTSITSMSRTTTSARRLRTPSGGRHIPACRRANAIEKVLLVLAKSDVDGVHNGLSHDGSDLLQKIDFNHRLYEVLSRSLAQAPYLVGFLPLGAADDDRNVLGALSSWKSSGLPESRWRQA